MKISTIIWILILFMALFSFGQAQLPDAYTRYTDALQVMTDLAANNPMICKLDTMGYSMRDSIPMLRLKISDYVDIDEDEPAVFFCGGVHADEVLGAEVVMKFMQDIIRLYNMEDPNITGYVQSLEIFCVPFINPEGHIVVESGNTQWRKNKCDNDNNGIFDIHDGVDNNRNYDFGWSIDNGVGATTPESLMYKGAAPFTQTENIAMADFAWEYRPLVALDYHSPTYGRPNVAYFPWWWLGNVGGHGDGPDRLLMQSICQNYTSLITAIPDDSGNGTYTARRALVNKGDFKTYFYGNFGTAAFSVEVSDTTIQDPALLDTIVTAHLPGQYYLLNRALGAGITGVIRDSITLEPIEAEVQVLQHINEDINPRLSRPDYGRYRRLLAPGSYTLRFLKDDYQTKTIYNVIVTDSGPTETDVLLSPLHPRPPAPMLYYPPQDSILIDGSPLFVWGQSEYADHYLYELYYDYNLTNPVFIDSLVGDTLFTPPPVPLVDSVYSWRIKGGNANGWGPYSELWSFTVATQSPVDYSPDMPIDFKLMQNRPNPFNPSTIISFQLPEVSDVEIEIYNVVGQKIDVIAKRSLPSGRHDLVWDGSGFSSGVYFYRVTAGSHIEVKKMTLLK